MRKPGPVGWGLDAGGEGIIGPLPEKLLPNPQTIITVSAWYQPEQLQDVRGPLVTAESYCIGWQLNLVESTEKIYATAGADGAININDPATFCPDPERRPAAEADIVDVPEPTHVVATFDRTVDGEVRLFVNGVEQQAVNLRLGDVENDISQFVPELRLGTFNDGMDNALSGGVLDEVLIFVGPYDDDWIQAHGSNIRDWSTVNPTPTESRD
jgi:hypothetical protein